jgi:hypothetical protein
MRGDAALPTNGSKKVNVVIDATQYANAFCRRAINSAAPCLPAHRRAARMGSRAGDLGSEWVR